MFGMQAAGQLGEARSAAAEALLGQAGLADRPAAEAQNFLNSMAAYSQIAKDDQSRQHSANERSRIDTKGRLEDERIKGEITANDQEA